MFHYLLKFIYSKKATKFCEIFTLLLSYVVPVKSKVKISQNFVAFSEYMKFTKRIVQKLLRVLNVYLPFESFSEWCETALVNRLCIALKESICKPVYGKTYGKNSKNIFF